MVTDATYEFPKKSMDALASLNLLGLITPRDLGGLGQNHVCAAMVVETIARYGCPSTAMIYGKARACWSTRSLSKTRTATVTSAKQ